MTGYVYFDLAEVERQLRATRDAAVQAASAGAKSAEELDVIAPRERFFEPLLAINLGLIGLSNEGRDAAFVGTTLGTIVANLLINTLGASTDPRALANAYYGTLDAGLAAMSGEPIAPGMTLAETRIPGTRGGRA